MTDALRPGNRVMFVGTEAWSIELYAATGTVLDGPHREWGGYGILLDPQHDPDQMVGAYERAVLDRINDGVKTLVVDGRAMVDLPGSKPLVYIKRRGWCPATYERAGRMYAWLPGRTTPLQLGSWGWQA
ncbi:hypothetical protein ABZY93_22355 [Streptomyces smyrnaeus]|uniref:hypothetical protein n=1 Tax=Streptomyces smyrnaeus TaxID=1387713 RepID=UPI0033BA8A78